MTQLYDILLLAELENISFFAKEKLHIVHLLLLLIVGGSGAEFRLLLVY